MIKEDLVIRVLRDAYANTEDIWLEDEEGDNHYQKLTPLFLESLFKRKLFESLCWMPSLNIEIITFRLKNKEYVQLALESAN